MWVAFDQLLRTNLLIALIVGYLKLECYSLRWQHLRDPSNLEKDQFRRRVRAITPV